MLAVIASLASFTAFAQGSPETPPGPQPAAPAEAAAPRPSAVTVRLQYTGEAAVNPIGGLHNGATYLNNVDAQVRVDADRAFGWQGGKFLVEGFYTNASSINRRYVGAVQDPSPIDTNQGAVLRLYQAYYEQRIDKTNILFGAYDLETEFGVTRPMDMFMNRGVRVELCSRCVRSERAVDVSQHRSRRARASADRQRVDRSYRGVRRRA